MEPSLSTDNKQENNLETNKSKTFEESEKSDIYMNEEEKLSISFHIDNTCSSNLESVNHGEVLNSEKRFNTELKETRDNAFKEVKYEGNFQGEEPSSGVDENKMSKEKRQVVVIWDENKAGEEEIIVPGEESAEGIILGRDKRDMPREEGDTGTAVETLTAKEVTGAEGGVYKPDANVKSRKKKESKKSKKNIRVDDNDEEISPELIEKFKGDKKTDFEFFWKSDSVFSQWYKGKFVVDGVEYNCAEQYMMHQKALLMKDEKTAEFIMTLEGPRKQKSAGRKVKNWDENLWLEHRWNIVKKGNIAKFSQNEKLKERLLNTFPKILVEASPCDAIWGICLHAEDKRAHNRATWKGKNLLGYILTEVRDEMRREHGMLEDDTPIHNSASSTVENLSNHITAIGFTEDGNIAAGGEKMVLDKQSAERENVSEKMNIGIVEEEVTSTGEGAYKLNENIKLLDKKRRKTNQKRITCGDTDKEISPELAEKFKNDKKTDFEFFWKSDSVFSQWYKGKFVVDDVIYNCAEQYMMHQKALLMKDEETARFIMTLNGPCKQKSAGRKVRNWDEKLWLDQRWNIVKKGNMEKFSQNKELRQTLLNTFPKILVEASPYDAIWGIGLCAEDELAYNRATWIGKNLLGYILTEIRDEMMREQGMLGDDTLPTNYAESAPEAVADDKNNRTDNVRSLPKKEADEN